MVGILQDGRGFFYNFDAEVKRLAADRAAYAAACAEVKQPDSPYAERDRSQLLCAEVADLIERNAENASMAAETAAAVAAAEEAIAEIRSEKPRAADIDIPGSSIAAVFAPDSELNAIAREAAERIIATARAEGTYPKYRRGDLF